MTTRTLSDSQRSTLTRVIRGLFWADGALALTLAVLLLATFVQLSLHEPLSSPALNSLIEQLDRQPDNAQIREEIRALHLLTRKAYFTTRWQLRSGIVLLLGAAALLPLLYKVLMSLNRAAPSVPQPRDAAALSGVSARTRNALALGAVAILCAALGAGLALNHAFSSPPRAARRASHATPAQMHRQWPSFRGADNIGISHHASPPLHWDGPSMSGVRWKSPLRLPGNSSPVIWGSRVFVSGADRGTREVYCYNLSNGTLLWSRNVRIAEAVSTPVPAVDGETGYAAPTMCTDGRRVFVLFATGELACFTLRGKPVWSVWLGTPENHYGHSSSLITAGGLLYVQYDQTEKGSLTAYDNATGAQVWRATRQELSWASPSLIDSPQGRELIVLDNSTVNSYNPLTGALLWSQACLSGEVAPSVAFDSTMLFVANEYAIASALNVAQRDEQNRPVIAWQWSETLPSTASPVAANGLVFFASAFGTVSCVSAQDGTTLWTHDYDKGFYASPIIAGGRVYALDRIGVMHVFEVANTFKPLATNVLGESADATPAYAPGIIVLRGEQYLYCITGSSSGPTVKHPEHENGHND